MVTSYPQLIYQQAWLKTRLKPLFFVGIFQLNTFKQLKNKLNKTDDKKKKVQSFKKFKAGQEPASASAPDMSEATLATARKNIGRDPKKKSCWKGYKATGTKMKDGRAVPDCKPA